MLRVLILRAALVALPFLAWFLWRAWAKRSGRQMGSTPWAWLAAAGFLLAGLSLTASPFLHADNRDKTYVPGEVRADGTVSAGHFVPKAK